MKLGEVVFNNFKGFFAKEIRLPANSERETGKREGFKRLEKVYRMYSGQWNICFVMGAQWRLETICSRSSLNGAMTFFSCDYLE